MNGNMLGNPNMDQPATEFDSLRKLFIDKMWLIVAASKGEDAAAAEMFAWEQDTNMMSLDELRSLCENNGFISQEQ